MVGCVGTDAEGQSLTSALAREAIDVSGIGVRDDVATGVAHITVDPDGANTIVVVAGANGLLGAAEVRREVARLPSADVVWSSSRSRSTPSWRPSPPRQRAWC